MPPSNVAVPPEIAGAPPHGTNHDDDNDEPGKSSKSKFPAAVGVYVGVGPEGVFVGVLGGVAGNGVFVGVFNPVGVGVGVLKGIPVVFCNTETVVPSALP